MKNQEAVRAMPILLALAAILWLGLMGASGFAAADIKNPQVVMETSLGVIRLELYPNKAPLTVKNFLRYVDAKFYDGTIFHRVIADFMIQGGGFTKGMKEKKTFPPIRNEAGNGLSNRRGTIAMARTPVVDGATAQFYINAVNNPALDHRDNTPEGFGYCVFGKVVAGMAVADRIRNVRTRTVGYFENVPIKDVTIVSIRRAN